MRPGTPDDAAALAELAAATFTETFGHLYALSDLVAFLRGARSESTYAELLGHEDTFIVLAERGPHEHVGYVIAGACKLPVPAKEPEAGEVRELYVLASHQGRRVGSRLLETSLEWLRERGRSPVYVGVWSENLGAQRLYARYGFSKVGEYDFPVGGQMDREFILKKSD